MDRSSSENATVQRHDLRQIPSDLLAPGRRSQRLDVHFLYVFTMGGKGLESQITLIHQRIVQYETERAAAPFVA